MVINQNFSKSYDFITDDFTKIHQSASKPKECDHKEILHMCKISLWFNCFIQSKKEKFIIFYI